MKIQIDENGIQHDLNLDGKKWYKLEVYFTGASYRDLLITEAQSKPRRAVKTG